MAGRLKGFGERLSDAFIRATSTKALKPALERLQRRFNVAAVGRRQGGGALHRRVLHGDRLVVPGGAAYARRNLHGEQPLHEVVVGAERGHGADEAVEHRHPHDVRLREDPSPEVGRRGRGPPVHHVEAPGLDDEAVVDGDLLQGPALPNHLVAEVVVPRPPHGVLVGEAAHVFQSGDPIDVRMDVTSKDKVTDFVFGLGLFNADNVCVYGTNTNLEEFQPTEIQGDAVVTFKIDHLDLVEGTYRLDLAAHKADGYPYDYHRLLYTFRVKSRAKDVGIYRPEHSWSFSPNIRFKSVAGGQ